MVMFLMSGFPCLLLRKCNRAMVIKRKRMFVQFCNYSWNAAGAYTVGQSKSSLIYSILFDVTVSVSSSGGGLEE
jgi:hypothetical protein